MTSHHENQILPYPGNSRNFENDDIRGELCEYSARLKRRGLTSATGGNVSHRIGEDMWISPTGCVMDELREEDWVKVNLDSGQVYSHRFKPSSEVEMHRLIYLARPDTLAIMHSHPPYVIALSLLGIELMPIGSESPLALGERIPLIPYEIPTSPLLARAVAEFAQGNDVMVLENHGLVTLGRNNREAYNRTELTEEVAKIISIAHSLGKGEPRRPSSKEIREFKDWYFEKKLPKETDV
jgi:L-fuculose-phosphate aldolase